MDSFVVDICGLIYQVFLHFEYGVHNRVDAVPLLSLSEFRYKSEPVISNDNVCREIAIVDLTLLRISRFTAM